MNKPSGVKLSLLFSLLFCISTAHANPLKWLWQGITGTYSGVAWVVQRNNPDYIHAQAQQAAIKIVNNEDEDEKAEATISAQLGIIAQHSDKARALAALETIETQATIQALKVQEEAKQYATDKERNYAVLFTAAGSFAGGCFEAKTLYNFCRAYCAGEDISAGRALVAAQTLVGMYIAYPYAWKLFQRGRFYKPYINKQFKNKTALFATVQRNELDLLNSNESLRSNPDNPHILTKYNFLKKMYLSDHHSDFASTQGILCIPTAHAPLLIEHK